MGYLKDCFDEQFSEREQAIAKAEKELKSQKGIKGQFKQGMDRGMSEVQYMHAEAMQAVMLGEFMNGANAQMAKQKAEDAKKSADAHKDEVAEAREANVKYQMAVYDKTFGHLHEDNQSQADMEMGD